MRGEVLYYDDGIGQGFISGDDGNRYSFERSDMQQLQPVWKGMRVDFRSDGDFAREIFIVETARSQIPAVAAAGQPGAPVLREAGDALSLFGYFKRALTTDYVNFRTRARRKEFWGFMLFVYLGIAVLAGIGLAVDLAVGNLDNEEPMAMIIILVVGWLAVILPSVSIMVRRQHDIGLSGWFYLLVLVPYIGSLILLVFALIPSQKHENKWGPIPAGIT